MKRRIIAVVLALLIALSLVALMFLKSNDFIYPQYCDAPYVVRYKNATTGESVIVDGVMSVVYLDKDSGTEAYSGKLIWENRNGDIQRSVNVQRQVEFNYTFSKNHLVTTTTKVTRGLGGMALDDDLDTYVYKGFRPGNSVSYLIMQIPGGQYLYGSNQYPRIICNHHP